MPATLALLLTTTVGRRATGGRLSANAVALSSYRPSSRARASVARWAREGGMGGGELG